MSEQEEDPQAPTEIDAAAVFRDAATPTDQTPDVSPPPGMWTPPTAEELDAQLRGFNVEKLLGRGGMGAVYQARQISLDRTVAIKILPPEFAEDPAFASRFEREAKSLAQLNHPNIVHIHDFGKTDAGHYFFVMEFVDGTDFHHLIQAGQLDAIGALNAVSQICDALAYAHSQGYVHRDIKPANVFLNTQGMAKVGDFGLAKIIGTDTVTPSADPSLTVSGVAMGTPFYSSPEQSAGLPVDQRADIYSLGVMFYEMLTGQIPRGHFEPPSKRVQIDVRIDDVVLRAMANEPEMRYQSAPEMQSEVDVIRTSPEEVPLETEPKKRSRWPIGLAGTIGMLGLAAAAFFLSKNGMKDELAGGAPSVESSIAGATKGSPFPLSLPEFPPQRPTKKCRLVVLPLPDQNPTPERDWLQQIEEDDFDRYVSFGTCGYLSDVTLLTAEGDLRGVLLDGIQTTARYETTIQTKDRNWVLADHNGIHWAAIDSTGRLLPTDHRDTFWGSDAPNIDEERFLDVTTGGGYLALHRNGKLSGWGKLFDDHALLQGRIESDQDIVQISRLAYLRKNGSAIGWRVNVKAPDGVNISEYPEDSLVSLSIRGRHGIGPDGQVYFLEKNDKLIPRTFGSERWEKVFDGHYRDSNGFNDWFIASLQDGEKLHFDFPVSPESSTSAYETALRGLTDVVMSEEFILALLPAGTVPRSGYWEVDELIEVRRELITKKEASDLAQP